MNPKEIARAYITAVNEYDVSSILDLVEENYIQHNPFVATGRAAFLVFLSKLKVHGSRIENLRLFQDGRYIFMHHIWHNAIPFGAMSALAFHIIRINPDGCIVEHWNVMNPLKDINLISSERAQGPRTVDKPNLTLDSRNRTVSLGQQLAERKMSPECLDRFFHKEYVDYSLPGPHGSNDLSNLVCGHARNLNYLRQHKVFAEGEFSLCVSEGLTQNEHVIIYDLFRFESGKIIGRWNISQGIPKTNLANDNTMFGFT